MLQSYTDTLSNHSLRKLFTLVADITAGLGGSSDNPWKVSNLDIIPVPDGKAIV